MRPIVLKWIECLKCILPIFIQTVQINCLFDRFYQVENELQFESLDKLYLKNDFIPTMDYRRHKLKYLANFKSIRWSNFMDKIHEMIAANDDVGLEEFKSFDEFFLKLLENVISYFKRHNITDQIVKSIPMFTNLNTRDVKISLENSLNNFRNYISTLIPQMNIVAENYENAKIENEIDEFIFNFEDLMAMKMELRKLWSELNKAVKPFAYRFFNEITSKRNTAKYMNYFFNF